MIPAMNGRLKTRHRLPAREASRRPCRVHAAAPEAAPLLVRVARGEEAERTPVWLMRQAGRYMKEFRAYSDRLPFRKRSEDPEVAVELSLQPWRNFRTDAVIMFSDILTPLPALGIEFDVIKGKGPQIFDPLRSEEAIKAVKVLDVSAADSQLGFVGKTLSTLKSEITSDTALIGFIGSPWTLAAYSIEGSASRHCQTAKTMMIREPELLHQLLSSLAQSLTDYACYQIESGAQVVQIFDSWAHHLSPEQFRTFSLSYSQRIIDGVKAQYPHVPLIFHANGGVGKLGALKDCTADVLGVDWGTDMAEARAALGSAVLQGNVDPLVLFGTEDNIEREAKACMRAAGDRHILNIGHGVLQGTPEEHVAHFVNVARQSFRTASEAAHAEAAVMEAVA